MSRDVSEMQIRHAAPSLVSLSVSSSFFNDSSWAHACKADGCSARL